MKWFQTMRRKPDAFAGTIGDAAGGAAVASVGFPRDDGPGVGHLVFAFVAAEGDAHVRIVTIGDGPFADFGADVVVFGVATLAQIMGVGRVEEDAAGANVGGDAGGEDAFPIAATDADTTQPGGELAHVGVET